MQGSIHLYPDGGVTPEIEQFGKCLYATDCLMDTNMRSFLNEDNVRGGVRTSTPSP